MFAFGDDPALKAFVLARLAEHRVANRSLAGSNRETGKGDAVLRTLQALQMQRDVPVAQTDATLYETELGIPRMLAHLEDQILEGLPEVEAQAWPERFIAAIRPGAALDMVWPQFALWLLDDELLPHTVSGSEERAAVADTVALFREWVDTGDSPEFMRWMRQSSAALGLADAIPAPVAEVFALYAAGKAAEAAGHAGQAAASSNDGSARWSASASHSVAAAARHAAEAAYRAAYSAAAPRTADAHGAASPARAAAAHRQADKLVELLAAAAPVERTGDKAGPRGWNGWFWWRPRAGR